MSLRGMIATDARTFAQETGEFGRAALYVTDAGSVPIHCTRYSDSPDARQDFGAGSMLYHGMTRVMVPRSILPVIDPRARIRLDGVDWVIVEVDESQPHRWLIDLRKPEADGRVPGRRLRP